MQIAIKNIVSLDINTIDEQTLNQMAQAIITRIRMDTATGIDYQGAAFKEYSDRYEIKRAKSGRSTVPNLQWSGRMLQNLKPINATANSIEIGFTGEELRKAIYNNERREFMGIADKGIDDIVRIYADFLERELNEKVKEVKT